MINSETLENDSEPIFFKHHASYALGSVYSKKGNSYYCSKGKKKKKANATFAALLSPPFEFSPTKCSMKIADELWLHLGIPLEYLCLLVSSIHFTPCIF